MTAAHPSPQDGLLGPLLLTDSDDPAIAEAVAALPSWRLEVLPPAALLSGIDAASGPPPHAVLLTTDDPALLRAVIDRARARR
ncbi:MAG: hypothetical protein M3336_06315, partial [Chloroflexota bacterium]|nr:hypothetical protein [Chloroflexota bacterium]